jgi:energy-converting hydrogenase Eha subunit G
VVTEMNDISTAERRSQIAQMVIENGQVFVSDLVEMFNVSEVSISRDLTILEENTETCPRRCDPDSRELAHGFI